MNYTSKTLLSLSTEEIAFYDVLTEDGSAVELILKQAYPSSEQGAEAYLFNVG